MAEDGQVAEVGASAYAADVRQPLTKVGLPDALPSERTADDALSLVQNQPFDQQRSDECLAEPNPVVGEGASALARDLHERPVGFLLVAVDCAGTSSTASRPSSSAVSSWPRKNSWRAFIAYTSKGE